MKRRAVICSEGVGLTSADSAYEAQKEELQAPKARSPRWIDGGDNEDGSESNVDFYGISIDLERDVEMGQRCAGNKAPYGGH